MCLQSSSLSTTLVLLPTLTHVRSLHLLFSFPGPPYYGMSWQFMHNLQSGLAHLVHWHVFVVLKQCMHVCVGMCCAMLASLLCCSFFAFGAARSSTISVHANCTHMAQVHRVYQCICRYLIFIPSISPSLGFFFPDFLSFLLLLLFHSWIKVLYFCSLKLFVPVPSSQQ